MSINNDGSIHTNRETGIKAWLSVLNVGIKSIENTVWKGRKITDDAVDAWGILGLGKKALLQDYQDVKNDAGEIPDKIARLSKTGWMLTRITASYRFWGTRSAFIPARKTEATLNRLHKKNARLFKDVSLEHGGAFLKVGQMLSARADILPEVWVKELQVLQDQAKEESLQEIRKIIQSELGGNLDKFFVQFEPTPIAAASIGQVHRATLIDGRKVAIKIQRPGLESTIKMDMSLMKMFLASLESILPETDLDTITSEIDRAIMEELDYEKEAIWMTKVGEFLHGVEKVCVPKVINELSTNNILVSEFIVGQKLTDELNERQEKGDHAGVSDLLGRLLDMYLRQVLKAGFFQADPHPGNILVTPTGELVLLDFGCTMSLPNEFRDGYLKILSASIGNDKQTIANELEHLGFRTRSGNPETLLVFADVLLETIQNAATSFTGENSGNGMEWPDTDSMMDQAKLLLEKLEADPVVKLPAEFIMLARVFTTLGGLFTHYKPELDVNKYLLPHLLSATLESSN